MISDAEKRRSLRGVDEINMNTTSERSLIGPVDYVTVERVVIRVDAEAFTHRICGR